MTAAGSKSLQAWLDGHGFQQVDLGRHLDLHQTAIHRALERDGLLTRDQVAKACAFTGGEVSAAALVGPKAAKRVPKLPPVERKPPAPPPTAAAAPAASDAQDLDVEALARAETLANIQRLRELRDDPATSRSTRARCIELLLEYGEGKPRQRQVVEKVEAPVEDKALEHKFKQLLDDAHERLRRALKELGNGKPDGGGGAAPGGGAGGAAEGAAPGAGAQPDAGAGGPPRAAGAA